MKVQSAVFLAADFERTGNMPMQHYKYLIIGGGMTADAVVRGIREIDAKGRIGIISSEPDAPYDRPPARQKGTGRWTSQEAMELQVPVPTIDAAVAMRDLSVFESDRVSASQLLKGPANNVGGARSEVLRRLRNALHAGMLLTYAQGMALLRTASENFRYELDLEKVARIWRGGCIIRCRLLDKISVAYNSRPELTNLVLAVSFAKKLSDLQADLRSTVEFLIKLGIPGPAFMASLAYYDTYRTARMASNLIQAQRHYFGAHTYERIDDKGIFHTEWKAG